MGKSKKLGWAIGGEVHEMTVDAIEIVFGAWGFDMKKQHQEGNYIYDLYIPNLDIPIEIGGNREDKLWWLLENKRMFGLVLNGNGDRGTIHWLITHPIGRPPQKYKIFNLTKSGGLKFALVTKEDIPGFKVAEEWMSLNFDRKS